MMESINQADIISALNITASFMSSKMQKRINRQQFDPIIYHCKIPNGSLASTKIPNSHPRSRIRKTSKLPFLIIQIESYAKKASAGYSTNLILLKAVAIDGKPASPISALASAH